MGDPADYFLPALSFLDDGPLPSSAEEHLIIFEQLDAIQKMIRARQSLCALTQTALITDPKARLASTINTMRTDIMACATGFLNTNLIPDGDLEGETSYSAWTAGSLSTSTLFQKAFPGKTGWTRIPSRNPFSLSASVGNLAVGDVIYKEHINDLLTVLQLQRYWIPGYREKDIVTTAQAIFKTIERDSATGNLVDTYDNVVADWVANGWTDDFDQPAYASFGFADLFRIFSWNSSSGHITLSNLRGKVYLDLRRATSGTPHLYFKFTSPGVFGQDRINSAAEGVYSEWTAPTLTIGDENTTGYLDYSDVVPDEVAQVGPSFDQGWRATPASVVDVGENYGL
jgi:hypothetical protein